MDFDELDLLAQRLMCRRKPHAQRERGSIYFHGKRVAKGVLQLRKLVTADSRCDDILHAAALFHDVGKGMEPHAYVGSALMKELLKPHMNADEVSEVCRLIASHDDRKPNSAKHDLLVRLLQDADMLDHFGTAEIWMCFSYYAAHDRGVNEALDFYRNDYKKSAARQRKLLNFDESKRIFDEKYRFQRSFVKRLKVEAEGGYMPFDDSDDDPFDF